jgi:hypothetical protein
MQGASVDPSGRLRVVNAAPSSQATKNGGFAFEPDGRLCITSGISNASTKRVGGLCVTDDGRLYTAAYGGAPDTWNKAIPVNSIGQVLAAIDINVPPAATFNDGMAVGINALFMTTAIEPPAPTRPLDLTQPLPTGYVFTRNSIATGIDENGYFTDVGVNEPRYYRIPGKSANLGMWFEAPSVNHWLNTSTAAGSAIVTLEGGSITAPNKRLANIVVPQGTITGVASMGSRTGTLFSGLDTTPGAYTDYSITGYFAAWGPKNYKPYIVIAADSAVGVDSVYATLLFDSVTGEVTAKNLGTGWSEITPPLAVKQPSGMWKFTWSVRFTQDATPRANVYQTYQVRNELNQGAYTADGVSGFQFGCLQFENYPEATSYIPTEQAWVTRERDQVLCTGTNLTSWFNLSEGTIQSKFTPTADAIAGGSPIWQLDDGSTANRMYTFFRAASSNGTQVNSAGVLQVDLTSNNSGVVVDETVLNCFGYKVNDFVVSGSKSALATDVVGDLPLTINRLLLSGGARGVAIQFINYWNTRLANAQIDELTLPKIISLVIPVNTVPPAVTGIPSSSNTLTCSTGTWTNASSYTYRWYNNNLPILGATNSTLTLNSQNAPVGSVIHCTVTAMSPTGNTDSAESNKVTVV